MMIRDQLLISSPRKYTATEKKEQEQWKETPLPVDMNRFVGIEVELENAANVLDVENFNYWEQHAENSLRYFGTELVTKPVYGYRLSNALGELQGIFEKYKPSTSYRTAIHFHIDFTKSSIEDLFKFMIGYMFVEYPLFHMVKLTTSFDRRKSNYSVPINDSFIWKWYNSIYRALTSNKTLNRGEFVLGFQLHGEQYRYLACNPQSLLKYGTIEFRLYPTILDINIIMSWLNQILTLCNYTEKTPLTKLVTTLTSLNTNSEYYRVLTDMLGPNLPFHSTEELITLCEQSVSNIKSCVANVWVSKQDSKLFELMFPKKQKLEVKFEEKRKKIILDNFVNVGVDPRDAG